MLQVARTLLGEYSPRVTAPSLSPLLLCQGEGAATRRLGNVSVKQSFKAPVSTNKSSRLIFIHVLKKFDERSKHIHAESGGGDPDPTLPLLF